MASTVKEGQLVLLDQSLRKRSRPQPELLYFVFAEGSGLIRHVQLAERQLWFGTEHPASAQPRWTPVPGHAADPSRVVLAEVVSLAP
jgi:hypothetical protein